MSRRTHLPPLLPALALAVALVAPPPAAAAQAGDQAGEGSPFTLEEVLSYTYAYPAAAAEDAGRIAWKVYERGVRNLWTAALTAEGTGEGTGERPGFEPVRLTSYTEDDGQNLGDLQLTPDGATLVYVRGNGRNRAGEHANPSSHPDGAEETIWAVATDGASPPRKLATGSGPVLSPDGTRLVFAHRGAVHELPVSGAWPEDGDENEDGEADGDGGDAEPREMFTARGNLGGLAWSPDGSRVAFTSNRGDHSFVGVYDREADALRWLAPSVDRDGLPVWSPDGSRVAFVRTPGARAGERFDLTAGNPFSVLVADPATGEAREAWRSRRFGEPVEPGEEAGGFAQYYPTAPLRWVDPEGGHGGRLLFTSEHTGWLHVHSIRPNGEPDQEAVDLTPGECESEASAVTADGRTMVFSSNCGDSPDGADGARRHLWRVPTTGGEPVPVTRGDGIETDPVVFSAGGSGGDLVAFRSAGARRPQAMAVARLDGSGLRVLGPQLPASFPADALVEPEPVVLQASDGVTVHGQLFVPPAGAGGGEPGGRHPAVIFLHGGPIRQMLLGFHYSDYYARAYAMNQYLASRGYVVMALNFRAGIGYGRDFRRAEGQGPRGATEYRDLLAAGLHLRDRPDVDPERIGLWGGSYGGYLTALGLARDSDLFAAGVDLHGVHDWALRATDFSEGGAWGLTEDLLERARASSPVADVDGWTSPVLLIHGDDDRNVLFLQTTDLVQRLRERGVETQVLVLPDEVHGFLRHESWLRALTAAGRFFERHLLRPASGAADGG